MKPWQEPRFYIRVRQGQRWKWLHTPPESLPQIQLTTDKRIATTVRLACYAEERSTPATLLAAADRALYGHSFGGGSSPSTGCSTETGHSGGSSQGVRPSVG